MEVRLHSQLDRAQSDEKHDKAIEILMLLDEMNVASEATLPMKEVK